MAKTETIALDEPIIGHGEPIKTIILKEPTYEDYMEIGDPYEIGESEGGVRFTVQNPEAVRAYIDRCLVQPKDQLLLAQCSAKIGRKVRLAVLGFFRDVEEAAGASTTSQTS